MKTKLLILCLYLIIGINVFAQNQNDSIEEIGFIDPEDFPNFEKEKTQLRNCLNLFHDIYLNNLSCACIALTLKQNRWTEILSFYYLLHYYCLPVTIKNRKKKQ